MTFVSNLDYIDIGRENKNNRARIFILLNKSWVITFTAVFLNFSNFALGNTFCMENHLFSAYYSWKSVTLDELILYGVCSFAILWSAFMIRIHSVIRGHFIFGFTFPQNFSKNSIFLVVNCDLNYQDFYPRLLLFLRIR